MSQSCVFVRVQICTVTFRTSNRNALSYSSLQPLTLYGCAACFNNADVSIINKSYSRGEESDTSEKVKTGVKGAMESHSLPYPVLLCSAPTPSHPSAPTLLNKL